MLKLGLIREKNAIIDNIRKEKKREDVNNLTNETNNSSKKEELREFLRGKGIIKSMPK